MTDESNRYTRSDSERPTSSGQDNESTRKETSPGSASENIAESSNNSGDLRAAPEVGEAEEAASQESRRIAAREDTEI